MSLSLTIAGEEKIKSVEFGSLQIDNVITHKVDTCSFSILSHADRPYTPLPGREVIVTLNGTREFAGIIINIESEPTGGSVVRHKITCSDYTRLLDQLLVPDSYQNMTAEEIIIDMMTTYAPAGFNTDNVDAPVKVKYVGFNYKSISKCLQDLADLIGYDWYIDYNKNLYFFSKLSLAAPIDVQDDNGSYEKDSLIIRKDNSQIRTQVIVRGGEYLGTKFTTEIETDGVRTIYPLPYRYSEFKATFTGNELDYGVDYLNDPNDHDILWNFNEKLIRFKDADKPAAAKTLRVSGKPYLPVIVKLKSQKHINSISSMEDSDGEYEYLITDKSINSKEGARQRAEAEILSYGETLIEAEFVSETSGLIAGQRIRVNSSLLNIDEYFIINRVRKTQRTIDTLLYHVSLITTKTADFVNIMQNLLLADTKKIEINENEIIDLVESYPDEAITMTDEVEASTEHNPQSEEITLAEVAVVQDLDYGVQFVAGPYTPTGTKRVFILNGSKLG